jgi:hypothetical protein
MSILLTAILLQASAAPAEKQASAPVDQRAAARAEGKICRKMLLSSSRLRPANVCRTRVAWQRWTRCHSATRYCAPPRQNTVTMVSMPDDELVCKYLKVTGSRLEQERICATKRQWEITEQETQESVLARQSQSLLPETQTSFRNPVGGGGPQ